METQEEFIKKVAENLVLYRKSNKLTQIQLAEKLNYSDKAISKWERGECLPDIYTLCQIADIYGISVGYLLDNKQKPVKSGRVLNGVFIPILSSCIVWLVAIIAFFVMLLVVPSFKYKWISFIIALPCTAVIFIVFSAIYKKEIIQVISISGFLWTFILTMQMIFVQQNINVNYVYLIGIPIQVAVILWYIFRYLKKKKKFKKN